jgi:NAD(P)-dependent dehydrogenase (short-subunit alcohol dehydrogenase family)
LTKSLAKEFGPNGVTANAISPGTIRGSKDSAPKSAAQNDETLRQIPLGHTGRPEDIAALAGFLCSDEGGFVSGQMIGSNGAAQT